MNSQPSDTPSTLDVFKNRTLSCLQAKNEPTRTYPLEAKDLIEVNCCPICHCAQPVLLTRVCLQNGLNFFNTSTCPRCHFTFRSLSPGLGWFQKCWKMIATETPDVFNPEAESIRLKRYRDYARLLKNYAPRGRMLDIGAAFGTGTEIFREQGYQVEALETEDNKHRYIEQSLGIAVHTSPIEEFLESGAQPYDLIVFAHCLEHLDRPQRVMKLLPRLLHKDSILFVEVPLMQEFVSWSDALFLTHKSNFSERNLADLATSMGFKILEKTYFRHTEAEGRDIGLVLQYAPGQPAEAWSGADLETGDIRELYRLGLQSPPPGDQPIDYEVPFIEHFFYTLRLTEWQIHRDSDSSVWHFRPAE